MKKTLMILSILAVTMLSGCAVYPAGYSYGTPSGVVYVDQTYVTPMPNTFIWINGHRGWGGGHPMPHGGYHR